MGEHVTVVEVDLVPPTVTVLLVPVLPEWTASEGEYVALPITVPAVVGAIEAEQDAVVLLTLTNVHGVPVNDPAAVPVLVKATVPAGVDAVPVEVSFTNAVHVVVCPTAIDVGEHVTLVEVVRRPTVTVLLVPVLPLWAVSATDGVYVALATAVPVPVAVNVTVQLDVVVLRLARVHGLPVKLPGAVPVLVNATVPAGALAVPAAEVSFTKAVQLVAWPITTVEGEHATEVEGVLRLTVTVLLVPELPL